MTITQAIIKTYGINEVVRIYDQLNGDKEQFKKIIRKALKRDCPNYKPTWGAMSHICNTLEKHIAQHQKDPLLYYKSQGF